MMDIKKTVSFNSRVAYSLTDVAGNLLYCTISSYLLYFYTDVFGLSMVTAGTILFVARIIDAIDAPIWGSIIDHTKSKYGQSRPWFLWLCVPFAVFTTLTFITPNLSHQLKVIYALSTYILAGICYTGIATPITSILPNLTTNSDERIVLNSYRMFGGNIGYVITAAGTLPLVSFLGKGNDQLGFSLTVGLYSLVAIPLFIYAFKNLKEVNASKIEVVPIKNSFKTLIGNWPWIILFSVNLCYWIANIIRASAMVYYFEYSLNMKDYIPLINGISLVQVLGVVLIPFIVKAIGKSRTMIVGLLIASLGQFIMSTGGVNISIIITGWLVACVGTGIAVSMPFAMFSDTVDYGEWKSGFRSSGFLTSIGSSLCIKFSSGIGAFISSIIMTAGGYIANTTQTAKSIASINLSFIYIPIFIWVLGALIMILYHKYEKNEPNILNDLKQRAEAR